MLTVRGRVAEVRQRAASASSAVDRARTVVMALDGHLDAGTDALRRRRASLEAIPRERLGSAKRWLERVGLVLKLLRLQRELWR